jgi:hypothetical protein
MVHKAGGAAITFCGNGGYNGGEGYIMVVEGI